MKTHLLLSAALLAVASPSFAQVGDINSASNSGAEANSGSISGAESNGNQQSQANIGGNNAGIGSSTSESNSGAVSGSESNSGAVSDQAQGQSLANTNQLGQTASNQQGVQVATTFNSYNRKKTINEVRTNAAVPLAASSSFSSDYCGGTASGGASIAPIGVSIGGAAPTFDRTCQYLRLSEKGGMMAANWHNMGVYDMRNRTMAFATWAMCMAGPEADRRKRTYDENVTMQACLALGLLGSPGSPMTPPPAPIPEPKVQDSTGYPTPEAVERYKTPRGDLQYESNPVVQTPPIAMAAHP